MGERKGRDDHWRRVSLTITPSAALNLIAPSACVRARERWTVAEHVDGWMCACSPMSRRYAAQSSTAIKRAKAWMLRPEEQGPESFGRQVLN